MKKLIIIAFVLVGGGYALLSYLFPHGSWNYKITLVVETPEGRVTGSAVRKVSASNRPEWLPESVHGHAGVRGEAVVVDLGKRGVLFVLLSAENNNDYGYNIVFQEFPNGIRGGTTPEGINYYKNLKAKKELAFNKLPMLVRFRDINDQKTVEQVDPNNLEKTFGEGVKLVSVTLEMTDDWATTGKIKKYLPWFNKWREHGGTISGKVFFDSPPLPETILIPMNFIQE